VLTGFATALAQLLSCGLRPWWAAVDTQDPASVVPIVALHCHSCLCLSFRSKTLLWLSILPSSSDIHIAATNYSGDTLYTIPRRSPKTTSGGGGVRVWRGFIARWRASLPTLYKGFCATSENVHSSCTSYLNTRRKASMSDQDIENARAVLKAAGTKNVRLWPG
jgi:hypothetical protein